MVCKNTLGVRTCASRLLLIDSYLKQRILPKCNEKNKAFSLHFDDFKRISLKGDNPREDTVLIRDYYLISNNFLTSENDPAVIR